MPVKDIADWDIGYIIGYMNWPYKISREFQVNSRRDRPDKLRGMGLDCAQCT